MKALVIVTTVLLFSGNILGQTSETKKAQTQPSTTPTTPALQPSPASAPPSAPPPPIATPVPEPTFPANVPKITAGYQEKTKDTVIARNYVDFTYEKYRIQCDFLEYNIQTQEIDAHGNVILEEQGQRLAGDKFHFNLKTKRGVMYDASGMAPPDLNFTGKEIEKYDELKYRSTGSVFTSCTQPNPRWKISSTKADIEMHNHVTFKNAVFKIKSIPVFYLPYMRYPIRDDNRATGFLIPNYGHSTLKGQIIGEAFFWAINRSQDATVAYRSFSEIGKGLEGEYRYFFSNTIYGHMNLFKILNKGITETTISNKDQDVTGIYLQINHSQTLPWNIINQTDIEIMTSKSLQNIYSSNFYSNADTRKVSMTSFSKSSGYEAVNVQLRHDYDYYGLKQIYINTVHGKKRYKYVEQSQVADYLPTVDFTHNQQKLGASPFLFSAKGSFMDYEINMQEYNTQSKITTVTPLYKFNKLTWSPTIALPITAIPWISFNPSFTYSGARWNDSLALDKNGQPKTDKNGNYLYSGIPLFRNTFISNISIYGPNINRIFLSPGSHFSKKWKHSIEPQLDLGYNTAFKDYIRVPLGDRDGYGPISTQRISYVITNTLWAKRTLSPGMDPSPVDILRWELKQTYVPNAIPNTAVKYPTKFYPLASTLTFRLAPTIDFSYKTNFNMEWRFFSDHQLYVTLTKLNSVVIQSGISISNGQKPGDDTTKYFTGGGVVNINSLGMQLTGHFAYSPDDLKNKLQNADFTVNKNFQCWGAEVSFQRYRPQGLAQYDQSFYFTLHIGSIGTISQRVGGTQF